VSWSYRVVKDKKGEGDNCQEWFQIHEVYYTKGGGIKYWSVYPITPCGSTLSELLNDLHMMMQGVWNRPVLERTKNGKKLKEIK
jgi:hypothetical protein